MCLYMKVCTCETLCVNVVYVVVVKAVCVHVMAMILCVGENHESPMLRLPVVSSTEKMARCVALEQIACSHDQNHGTALTCLCELIVSCVPVYTYCIYSLCPVCLSFSVPIPVQGCMCVNVETVCTVSLCAHACMFTVSFCMDMFG